MFDTLYARIKVLAHSRHAEASLAAIAFAESSFFPIPPDVLLAPMALAHPEWIRHDGRKACLPRPDGLCVALEGDGSDRTPWRCRAYELRPRACSDLAPGSHACLVARRRTGLSR